MDNITGNIVNNNNLTNNELQVLRNLHHKNIELYLLSCGIEACKPCHTFGPGTRDKFLLHIVLSGKGEFMSDGVFYELRKNHAFIIYPGQEVYYRADPYDPWTYTWVSFSGALADTYLASAGIDRNTHILDLPEDTDIPSIIKRMLDAEEINYSNEIKRQGLLLELLASLISYKPATEDDENERYNLPYMQYTEHAIEYININYMNDISIIEISDALGITRSYLAKCFTNTINMSPKQYIISYRMSQACELLRTTRMSVSETATAVGYSNALTFSKAFKHFYGISPLEWRARSTAYKAGSATKDIDPASV